MVSLQNLFTSLLDEFYDAAAFAALEPATVALWMQSTFVFALVRTALYPTVLWLVTDPRLV